MDKEEELVGATSLVKLLKRGYGGKPFTLRKPFTAYMAKRKNTQLHFLTNANLASHYL
jgi:hypothetical protein